MNLIEKMIRAAKLESEFYEEVEKDEEATREALLVVLTSEFPVACYRVTSL